MVVAGADADAGVDVVAVQRQFGSYIELELLSGCDYACFVG